MATNDRLSALVRRDRDVDALRRLSVAPLHGIRSKLGRRRWIADEVGAGRREPELAVHVSQMHVALRAGKPLAMCLAALDEARRQIIEEHNRIHGAGQCDAPTFAPELHLIALKEQGESTVAVARYAESRNPVHLRVAERELSQEVAADVALLETLRAELKAVTA